MSILARRSGGGNPLFLQELLSATRVAGTTEGLPDTVEAMVRRRSTSWRRPTAAVLRVASVLGLRFRSALAERLLDEPATAGAALAAVGRLRDPGRCRLLPLPPRADARRGLRGAGIPPPARSAPPAGESIERERARTTPISTCWRCTSSTATCTTRPGLLATGRRRWRSRSSRSWMQPSTWSRRCRARRRWAARCGRGRGASRQLGDLRERIGPVPAGGQRIQRRRGGCSSQDDGRCGPALLQALRAGGAERQATRRRCAGCAAACSSWRGAPTPPPRSSTRG